MKTKILFSTLFLIVFMLNISLGQNAYYYTLKLKKIKEAEPSDTILASFWTDTKFQKNSYNMAIIKDYIDKKYSEILKNETNRATSTSSNEAAIDGLFKKVPLNTQSIIIDALAKYTAERFKEEATTMYIDKFRRTLTDVNKPYHDFKYLIPETFDYLNTGDFFNYKEISSSLKTQFEEDLDNGLIGLKKYVDNATITNDFRNRQKPQYQQYQAISFSLDLGQQLKGKKQFPDIINYLDLNYKDNTDYKSYYGIIHTINLIQENMRRAELNRVNNLKTYWLKPSDWQKFNDKMDWVYYAAFIYYEDPDFFDNLTQNTFKSKNNTAIKNYMTTVIDILQSIDEIQSSTPEIRAERYVEMFSHFHSLLELVNTNHKFIDSKYIDISKYSIEIAKTIIQKNYGNTVSEGVKLLNVMLENNPHQQKVVAYFTKYSTFMIDVSTAKDSDELKEVIKRNVTEFSYLDKRKSPLSLTLNAEPGIIPLAYESISKNWQYVAAVTCPIGIDIVGGKKTFTGLSVNIFDIAAAFSYRLNDSESKLPEKLSFKQVFSPGGAIKGGFKNTPISWAAGYQYTPSLRGIKDDKIENVKNASRIFFRLTWDLPLVKFYSKDSE